MTLFRAILITATAATLVAVILVGRPWTDSARSIQLDEARSLIAADWPLLQADWPTTDGQIYLENLDGQIATLQKRLRISREAKFVSQLALLRYHRFQVTGEIAEAEAALGLAGEGAASAQSADAHLAYAAILLGFHEFDAANAALDAAALHAAAFNGGNDREIARLRKAVAKAQGKSVPAEQAPVRELALTPAELVVVANDRLQSGRLAEASRLLRQAQDRYQDSGPYVLAWIHVQQGIVFLQHEDYASARLFFAAAHQRFPQFTLAAEHLAETELALGNFEVAAALYREVAERSGHPEFFHQLSVAQRALGDIELAEASAKRAQEGYRQLIERHPLMYADHAVHYYMDIGERDEAVRLASLNFDKRPDSAAETLLATARACCP